MLLKPRLRISVRFKIIAYFAVLIGVAFFVVITVVTQVTANYLIDQRVKDELASADALAVEAAPYLALSDVDALWRLASAYGREHNGRALVLGMRGTVLVDGQSALAGQALGLPEVSDVLDGSLDRSYGFHRLGEEHGNEWVGYFTSVVVYDSQQIGILLVSTSIQELMDRLTQMRMTLLIYFAALMAAVIYIGAAMSGVITRPINALAQVLSRTSRGDFSARVNAGGTDELAGLGRAFNMMSERLERQDQMRNDFISNASHELKTPLSAMKILVESLIHQRDFDPEITREFLGDVNKEIDRLSNIVTELLVLVRFDSQGERMNMGAVRLGALLEDTCQRLMPVAGEAGVELTLVPHQEIVLVGDGAKLQQVFYNLIDNAIKYTPRGGCVLVQARRSGQEIHVAVEDDGIGISEQDLGHIFDRFYRVDKARSRATGGTGLGLSIARNIVLAHGGDIQVASKEGEGTTFVVVLPAVKE